MGAIQNDWLEAVGGEFHKPYYKELYEFVKEEYNTKTVYPPADDIFNAPIVFPFSKMYYPVFLYIPQPSAAAAVQGSYLRTETPRS